MEAVIYNHAGEDAAQRRADLRQAMQAFLTDTSSCTAVHVIGLFVRIPVPSTITAAAPSSAFTADNGPSSSSPSVATPHAPKRQRSMQKLAWCALEAERRLRQAAEDAAELNRWMLYGALHHDQQPRNTRNHQNHKTRSPSSSVIVSSISPPVSAGVKVVVVAYLAPQARDDVTVYESWQRCAEACTAASPSAASSDTVHTSQTTRRLSPLHRAAFVALSLGTPSLLLTWAEHPRRCFVSNLLLPHQSLLMDLSWCIDALHTPRAEGAGNGETVADGTGRGRVTSQVLLDLFSQDVLPALRFPKGDSRCAFWFSYASLMAALHPRVFLGDGAELRLAVQAAPQEGRHRESRISSSGIVDNADAFAVTHQRVRQVFGALFQNSPTAPGRTQALRVLLSYGGSVSSLKRQLVHVAGGRDCRCGGASPFSAPTSAAALLRTRSLVDIHALFGVLMGHDRTDVYAAAAAFVRTAVRRSATPSRAAASAATVRVAHALESTLVQVNAADTAAAATPALRGTANAFVEVGARALARKRARLERCRLGKTRSHLRPRDCAARARKHSLARKARQASTLKGASTGAASRKAGKKRHPEQQQIDTTSTVIAKHAVAASAAGAPPAKKSKGEAVALPGTVASTASETLCWSVDVG
ncbi:hypothetical protein ABB37_05161 [Leptomonas pyrrhocoris]|uniref:Uncharacterized protein n=1 Tax=Leptomonas pyrrhocoris TaxID=157538 RepID=A0A0M9G1C4_LEPPY|nr:hypothetical protein ABB37_05161 [Leptomonas pyrrhocoris]KPA80179.1 hypothetical protein ABB37_05161 [Leptomonas pyrrhocoris]|eukprot:XP_015658618.1 hypothetical protein ABB37_05161 [Leptomonas pyrrhocoris]